MRRRKPRKKRGNVHFEFHKGVKMFGGAVIALIIIIIIINVFIPKAQYQAEAASMELNINTTVAVIRDENAYYAEYDFGKINFRVEESKDVKQGDSLATIYKLGYTEDVAQKLYDVQKKIYEMQMSLMSGINKPEVDDAEKRISDLKIELQNTEKGEGSRDISEIESDIRTAIESRNSLLRDMVQPTEQLTSLYNEEETRKKQLDEWTGRIIAGMGGRFSCYTDGMERSFCMEKMNNFTVSQMKKAIAVKGYSTTGDLNNFMYRIVDPNHFCIGLLLEENATLRTYVGDSYTVRFNGIDKDYEAKCITAKIMSVDENKNEKKLLCILEINDDIGDLISVRSLDANIKSTVTGAKIRKNALSIKSGKAYVDFVISGKITEKNEVEVLATDEKYAIIRAKDEEKNFVGSWYSTRKD